MKEKQLLNNIEKAEKNLLSQIDADVDMEKEIDYIATEVAKTLARGPIAVMSIQNRDFLVISKRINTDTIEVVAREKSKIILTQGTVIKAKVELDEKYTLKENLQCGIKALLGHITGYIKPEVLD